MPTSKSAAMAKPRAAVKRPVSPKAATRKRVKAATKTIAKTQDAGRRTQDAGRRTQDAIAILRADHRLVSGLFSQYEKTRSVPKKHALVAQICIELNVHAQVEEEIFYPAVKAVLRDRDLVPEATVEHATLKYLIAQVDGLTPEGEMFDAKITVLSEYVKHHVKEAQNEMFPKAKSSKLDMQELGQRILARKQELKPQMQAKAEHPGVMASIKNAMGLGQ